MRINIELDRLRIDKAYLSKHEREYLSEFLEDLLYPDYIETDKSFIVKGKREALFSFLYNISKDYDVDLI